MIGYKHSKKTKLLLREKALKQFKNGMPEETRKKLSIANRGERNGFFKHRHTDKIKIQIQNNTKKAMNNPEIRRKFEFAMNTPEHKQKLRIARIRYIENTIGFIYPTIGKYEKQILDKLQNIIGFNIKRQFYINGYWLDGYCQELNLAIEVDEEHHYKNNILRQKDIDKQENITKSLNCNFIRIRVKDTIKNAEEIQDIRQD